MTTAAPTFFKTCTRCRSLDTEALDAGYYRVLSGVKHVAKELVRQEGIQYAVIWSCPKCSAEWSRWRDQAKHNTTAPGKPTPNKLQKRAGCKTHPDQMCRWGNAHTFWSKIPPPNAGTHWVCICRKCREGPSRGKKLKGAKRGRCRFCKVSPDLCAAVILILTYTPACKAPNWAYNGSQKDFEAQHNSAGCCEVTP